MGIPVKLPAFEGPLDLLLHLIESNKIDIYDIPIVSVTDQYMEYISAMDTEDLDVMSDFLVMAATLLDIKARMLLPAEVNEEGEEIDPRSELTERLLEYKMYRYMAQELKDRENLAEKSFYRSEDMPPEVASYQEPVNLDELLKGVSPSDLLETFRTVMRRCDDKVDSEHGGFGVIEREEVSLEDRMSYVQERLRETPKMTFGELLGGTGHHSRMQVIVTFLAVLELMKLGEMSASQDETFGEIRLEARRIGLNEENGERESETEKY